MVRRVGPARVAGSGLYLLVAVALVGLIVLLATLQYRWLGQITEADRERRRALLTNGAAEFSQDIDRELTRAYLLFQADPADAGQQLAERFAARYDRWQASSRFPRLLRELYVLLVDREADPQLRRFNPATRTLEPADWPSAMAGWREHFGQEVAELSPPGSIVLRRMAAPLWAEVPAVVSPLPLSMSLPGDRPREPRIPFGVSYSIATIDMEYLAGELLPSLAERHFAGSGSAALGFQVAVFDPEPRLVFQSDPDFTPAPDAAADLTREFFRVRVQDFRELATEVHRFTALALPPAGDASPEGGVRLPPGETRALSIFVQSESAGAPGPEIATRAAALAARALPRSTPPWTLLLKHPSGSLDAAVNATRRRNVVISSTVLAILGASVGLLVVSTRRAQRLARQQMEFVAAVSHELRTPLAVIRSAAENLADGVVRDEPGIRRYGELVRNEGRRLTVMVEQILELSGIQSGQRGLALHPVGLDPLLRDVVSASADLIERAGMQVDFALPADLPPVLGDETALRRLFENLVGNAIKYGASGGWIGLSASRHRSRVQVVVADRGMGIAPAEQSRIFEPFYRAAAAVAARIHGAGLGLSLVQRIAEAHGGTVTVKSAPGAGSDFIVQLPAAEDTSGAIADVEGSRALERGAGT